MDTLGATDFIAWAVIVGGGVYWMLESRGVAAAAVTATLAALVVKTALLEIG